MDIDQWNILDKIPVMTPKVTGINVPITQAVIFPPINLAVRLSHRPQQPGVFIMLSTDIPLCLPVLLLAVSPSAVSPSGDGGLFVLGAV